MALSVDIRKSGRFPPAMTLDSAGRNRACCFSGFIPSKTTRIASEWLPCSEKPLTWFRVCIIQQRTPLRRVALSVDIRLVGDYRVSQQSVQQSTEQKQGPLSSHAHPNSSHTQFSQEQVSPQQRQAASCAGEDEFKASNPKAVPAQRAATPQTKINFLIMINLQMTSI